MSAVSTLDRIRRILADQTGEPIHRISPETKLRDLRIDSLDTVELVMELEDAFNIEVFDRETEALVAVADVEALVRQKLGAEAGS